MKTTYTRGTRVVRRAVVPASAIIAIALMLFSMFFGAGNLIFPPVVAALAGSNFPQAITGFLLGAVILPVVSIIAVALSGRDARSLGSRGGAIFAVGFPVAIYLAIGAMYAIPRTGAVSFSTAVSPVFGWDSTFASIIFNVVFFGLSMALALNPSNLINNLGKILTPALLALLALMIILAVFMLSGAEMTPMDPYTESPLVFGLLDGYMTMDSLAALAFGTLVISALRHEAAAYAINNGMSEDEANKLEIPSRTIIKMTTASAVIAGGLLALIYVGLGYIGYTIEGGQNFPDGAALLSFAAQEMMGKPGQVAFGLTVLLACLTTSVGLLAACSEFFNRLVPKISYKIWLITFTVVSFGVASLGLETVLSVAGPIIGFLYPIAITVVAATLLDFLIQKITGRESFVFYGFGAAAWVSVVFSALMVATPSLVSWAPLADFDLGWVLPVTVAYVIGLIVDASRRK